MDDAGRVRRGQRVGDMRDDPRGLRNRQRPARQAFGQRLALVVGHRDERLSFELADFVDRADVRVIQGAGGARLAQQALGGLPRPARRSAARNFKATRRCSFVSSASQTVPIPPAPR